MVLQIGVKHHCILRISREISLEKTSKMPQSHRNSPARGRLTSTGLHPMRGLPPPERLVKKRNQATAARVLDDFPLPKEWQAGVSKVESCSLTEYDGGRGLKTVFPKEGEPKRRCNILCTGGTGELAISLEIAKRHQDPSLRSFIVSTSPMMTIA